MPLCNYLAGIFSLLALIQVATALLTKEGREYCEGKDSICEVWKKFEQDCKQYTGSDYWKCICTSGSVPVYIACYDCYTTMGDDVYANYSETHKRNCERAGYSIAPMPSSIIKQQEAHNKTATVPSVSKTAKAEATDGIDLSYTTYLRETYTTTMYGTPTASLPDITAATETSGSIVSYAQSIRLMTAAWVLVLASVILIA